MASKHLQQHFEDLARRGGAAPTPAPTPDPGWYARQREAVRVAAAEVNSRIAGAAGREAALVTNYEARKREAAATYVGGAPRAVLDHLRKEFEASRRTLLAEAQKEVAAVARAVVDLAAAADRVRATHLSPFAWLRRSRRTGAAELSEVDAAQLRAALSTTLRHASEVELRGYAEQAIGERNEILSHAVANELARRDAGPGAFVKLLDLGERDAADALLGEAVADAGRALAGWSAFARQGTAASGATTLAESLRLNLPPGAAAGALADWHGELASLSAGELRLSEADAERAVTGSA